MTFEQKVTITLTDKENKILIEAYEVLNNISRVLENYNYCLGDEYDAEDIGDIADKIDDICDYFKVCYTDTDSQTY